MPEETDLDTADEYTDSMSIVQIYRGVKLLRAIRGVVQWTSNVGYHMKLRGGGLVNVEPANDGTFRVTLPGGEGTNQ